MSKPTLIPGVEVPPLDKWKLIQFAQLNLFDDSDEELKMIGMTPIDISQFREWQRLLVCQKDPIFTLRPKR